MINKELIKYLKQHDGNMEVILKCDDDYFHIDDLEDHASHLQIIQGESVDTECSVCEGYGYSDDTEEQENCSHCLGRGYFEIHEMFDYK